MVQVAMTPEDFKAKAEQLRAEQGLDLSGSTGGQVSKDGITAEWAYDGKRLTVTVLKKPFFYKMSMCEDKLRTWLSASAVVLLMFVLSFVPARAQSLPDAPSTVQHLAEIQSCSDQYDAAANAANDAFWLSIGPQAERFNKMFEDFSAIGMLLAPIRADREPVFRLFCGAADRAALAAIVAQLPKKPTEAQVRAEYLSGLSKRVHAELENGGLAKSAP